MNKIINVAVADDHDLVRKGIVSLLKEDPKINIVFDVPNGQQLINRLKRTSADVVILDLEMPVMDGQEALGIISKRYPKTRVIVLSMHHSNEYIMDCLTHGARGFLPKNSDIEKLVEAIYSVHETGFFVDGNVSKILIDHAMNIRQRGTLEPMEKLSEREIEVIKLICDGLLNKEIAEVLSLSIRTVEAHRKNIIKKTQVTNVAGLMHFAVQNGLYRKFRKNLGTK